MLFSRDVARFFIFLGKSTMIKCRHNFCLLWYKCTQWNVNSRQQYLRLVLCQLCYVKCNSTLGSLTWIINAGTLSWLWQWSISRFHTTNNAPYSVGCKLNYPPSYIWKVQNTLNFALCKLDFSNVTIGWILFHLRPTHYFYTIQSH